MALKDLIIQSEPRPAPEAVIVAALERFGVRASVQIAASIVEALRREGYQFLSVHRRP